jgi:hypothetical protein
VSRRVGRQLAAGVRAVALITLIATPARAQERATCPQVLFETGFDKRTVRGTKSALIAAVERGEPIRIGWFLDFNNDGTADLSHWADAQFLSVFEGEVFAQLGAIMEQSPVRGRATVRLGIFAREWRGLLGSNGSLQGRFTEGNNATSDAPVAVRWCAARSATPEWIPVYVHGPDGVAEQGSIQALIDAVRAGRPIQIGWGATLTASGRTYQVEHVASPVFTTIVGGATVVAQLPEHIAQRSYVDPTQSLFDSAAVMWRGLMSTSGTFDAVMVNRATGETVRRLPQRARLVWFAQGGAPASAVPLSTPGGVRVDSARTQR